MKAPIFFSICRYVPSLLRGEKVNVGFAYHLPSEGKIGFYHSKNMKRLKTFDDEIDVEMINAIFDSLKYDFSTDNLDSYDEYDEKNLKNNTLLDKKIMNYVNQIQFSDVSIYETDDDLKTSLEDIADMYLYYDKPKNQRINHKRVESLAKKIIKSSSYKNYIENSLENDVFYDPPYDFKLNVGGKVNYIKALSFDYKQANRFYKEVKSFLFDLEHELRNSDTDISSYKIVVNNTKFEKEHEKIIYDYLPADLKIYTLEMFGELINKEDVGIFRL